MSARNSEELQLADIASNSGRRACGQADLRMNAVDNLPAELLQMIFISYFHATHSPVLLLLVCRRWRDIALDLSSLWSTILFDPLILHTRAPNFEQSIHKPITCVSFKHLHAASKRAGGSLLNVVCNLTKFDADAKADPEAGSWISPRCRCLYIIHVIGDFGNFVTPLTNFANLEEMGLIGLGFNRPDLHPFLINVEKTARRLTKLRIVNVFSPDFARYPAILERLRTLEVAEYLDDRYLQIEPAFFEHLNKLEVLEWPYGVPTNLSYISENLHSLSISQCLDFPPLNFPRLVSLQLKCVETSKILHLSPRAGKWAWTAPIHFPALKNLDYAGIWSNFTFIRVPVLLSLIVDLQFSPTLSYHAPATFSRPHSLKFYYSLVDEHIVALLDIVRAQFPYTRRENWSPYNDIEHLCIMFDFLFLGRSKVSLPQLETLTLNTLDPDRMSLTNRERVKAALEGLIDGFPTLRRVNWTWDIRDKIGQLSKKSTAIL